MAAGAREHGGDPRRVMAEAGIAGAPGDLLDLSTGINPVPYRFRSLLAASLRLGRFARTGRDAGVAAGGPHLL